MEDHQIKLLSDADLKSEHAFAVQQRNGPLAALLQKEITSREANKPQTAPAGNHTGLRR
jgi:hypothetical protein